MSTITRRALLQAAASGVAGMPFMAGAPASAAVRTPQPTTSVAERRARIGKAPIVVSRLTETVAMLSGPGGNVLVLSGSDGTVVVDTFVRPAWAGLKRSLAGVGPAPVRVVIDTHWHFDHADNNDGFRQAGAVVLAHVNTARRMLETHVVMGMQMTPVAQEQLPTETFTAGRTIEISGERIEARHIPPAHTDTDISVHFTRANVLHLGDVYFNGGYPFIDTSTGGNIDGQIEGATLALRMVDPSTRIVPGHGPLGDASTLLKYRDMLVTVRDRVRKLKASGRTFDEVVAARPTADLDAEWSAFMSPAAFIETVFATLR